MTRQKLIAEYSNQRSLPLSSSIQRRNGFGIVLSPKQKFGRLRAGLDLVLYAVACGLLCCAAVTM